MSYKTIAVCLNNQAEAERILPLAVLLARKFSAHLIALYSAQKMEIRRADSMKLSENAISEVQSMQEKQATEIKNLFDTLTRNEAIDSEWRVAETSAATVGEQLAEQTRCADLVVMSQIDPDNSIGGQAAIQRHIIEHAGRPVLVIPCFANISDIGTRVLIGWSGTGECARAVHDALPFFKKSTESRIFWVSGDEAARDQKLEQSGRDAADALARHGVAATVSHRTKTNIPIGDELLNEATDASVDLIVTGAFGHSRLYDFVIGATTSHLLKYMTVPVLFSN